MNIKTVSPVLNKRKKFLDGFDISRALEAAELKGIGVSYRYDVKCKNPNEKLSVWEFFYTKNNRDIKDREVMTQIHEAIQSAYPKTTVQDLRIQAQYAPEQVTLCIGTSVK